VHASARGFLEEHLGVVALAEQAPVVVGEADHYRLDLALHGHAAQLLQVERARVSHPSS
jgi:hypothetical protein